MTNTTHNYIIPPKTWKIQTNCRERITKRSMKTKQIFVWIEPLPRLTLAPFPHWGTGDAEVKNHPGESPTGLSKVPSFQAWSWNVDLRSSMLCLLPGPLAYWFLPFWFILLHVLWNVSKQRQKCLELWKALTCDGINCVASWYNQNGWLH